MRISVRLAIVAFVVGAFLIVTGAVLIEGSRHMITQGFSVGNADGRIVYYIWNESQLAMGTALALTGTVSSAASLTYLYLNRKSKGV